MDDFLNAFTPMIPAINAFFEDVLVMVEDEKVRQNRLALLQRIARLADGVAGHKPAGRLLAPRKKDQACGFKLFLHVLLFFVVFGAQVEEGGVNQWANRHDCG